MIVYRIVGKKSRSSDLSGQGAANVGGRWNSLGTHALYTSESRALALLEVLVHVDLEDLPVNMYIMVIEINENSPVLEISDRDLPDNWHEPDNLHLRTLGDRIFKEGQFLAIKARSAILPAEYNYILNPRHESFSKNVRILKVEDLLTDQRLK